MDPSSTKEASRTRKLLWFVGIWAASVVVVGGVAEVLHWWIMLGSKP
ncbi:DUF2474 domain-containing protein [Lichenihabitans sp. PAMC28606]|nr:DUF2474 domain-containing protein [Lichenihabitans sp. PAMC28606]UDL93149.1 DUF2474 domain-containing protein [Lichenihabitans sp. PAMC28606]